MKDLGIPFTREQAELFQKRYKENQSHLHVSGVMTQLLDECEAAGVKMGVITNGPFPIRFRSSTHWDLINGLQRIS